MQLQDMAGGRRADTLILHPDILDESLLSRRVLPLLRYAREHLLVPNPTVWPALATLYCMPVQLTSTVGQDLTPGGLDVSVLDSFRWAPCFEVVRAARESHFVPLARPVPVFKFDFQAKQWTKHLKLQGYAEAKIKTTRAGVCNAICFWPSYRMRPDSEEETCVFPESVLQRLSEGTQPNHSPPGMSELGARQAIQWMPGRQVEANQTLHIQARHNGTRVVFQVRERDVANRFSQLSLQSETTRSLPRWMWSQACDASRNVAFGRAIRNQLAILNKWGNELAQDHEAKKGQKGKGGARQGNGKAERHATQLKQVRVLDVGCGPGLFALAALKAGAAHVTAVDSNQAVINSAQKIAQRNGLWHGSKLTLLQQDLQSVTLARRADLLIFQDFDYGCLGGGLLPQVRHAWTNLLHPWAHVVPYAGRVLAVPLQWVLPHIQGFDVGALEAYRHKDTYEAVQMDCEPDMLALGPPTQVYEFDLRRASMLEASRLQPSLSQCPLPIHKAGRANAVLIWYELFMDPNDKANVFSTAPACLTTSCASTTPSRHSAVFPRQAVQVLSQVVVEPGETLHLLFRNAVTHLSFAVDDSKTPPERRTGPSPADNLLQSIAQTTQEMENQLYQGLAGSDAIRLSAVSAARALAIDPGSFGGSSPAKDSTATQDNTGKQNAASQSASAALAISVTPDRPTLSQVIDPSIANLFMLSFYCQ
eukprot:gb/GEZN01002173.1/.p1 GENE.gb/GEZN01002173.1/~~gb/GEZN01002173.1/.p1  ORF type:complete len:799 (+),score=187.42 gb/GEZN01002173.1/:283-2397(+)